MHIVNVKQITNARGVRFWRATTELLEVALHFPETRVRGYILQTALLENPENQVEMVA